MKYFVFTIKDMLSSSFGELKVFENTSIARRWFLDFCQKSPFANDLQLYKVGSYDLNTGEIIPELSFVCGGNNEE